MSARLVASDMFAAIRRDTAHVMSPTTDPTPVLNAVVAAVLGPVFALDALLGRIGGQR